MSDRESNRVLGRNGARELGLDEVSQIGGGFFTQRLTGPLPSGRFDMIFDH